MAHKRVLFLGLIGCLFVAGEVGAQADVIVGDLMEPVNYGSSGGIAAFAFGTTSCNIGTVPLNWNGNTNQHPVIGQNAYRLKDGRFEQVGQSWLKQGFTALAQNLCSTCQNPGTGSLLGVGCSDPYVAQLNGQQSNLSPKTEVNPVTGFFPFPPSNPAFTGNIARRLQIAHPDLDVAQNAGAVYFIEGQYITPDDAFANNDNNNASYRRVNFSANGASYAATFNGAPATVRQSPGIQAWKDSDPTVSLVAVDVPNDGRILVAYKATSLGGGMVHHEYAVQNLNSHRAVGGFSVPVPVGANIQNVGFHDVPYHSNDPFLGTAVGSTYTGADWPGTITANGVAWLTETFATNERANAIRWGTMYNFRFDSDLTPGNPVLELWRPGTPANVQALVMPPFSTTVVGGVPAEVTANQTNTIDIQCTNLAGTPDPSGAQLFVSQNGGPFTASPLVSLGGGLYRGTLPSVPCFTLLDWYYTINAVGGGSVTVPLGAPNNGVPNRSEAVLPVLGVVFQDDMDGTAVPGYTITSTPGLTAGSWSSVPVVPGNFAPLNGAPPSARGGSGKCYVTANTANADVDGSEARLDSPTFSLAGYSDARVSVWVWFDNDTLGANTQATDALSLFISNNNGSTWTLLETRTQSPNTWVERRFRVAQYLTPTATMKLRFVAADPTPDATVEAAIDSIKVEVAPNGPYLGPAARGNVGIGVGGPYDTININGSSGGSLRRVDVPSLSAVILDILNPPTNPNSSAYAIYAQVGWPQPSDTVTLPYNLGQMAFAPCVIDPTNPLKFTLFDNIPIGFCAPFVPGTPTAPYTLVVNNGFTGPASLTLQGLIVDPSAATGFAVTNGIILNVQ